ncbi:hypothetical protein HRI_002804000 [Hibiscus trionum]|uniref:Uncharacterized protein n=1 Tax=Hibiscus trionum TaxID=183268 RepID=A0A9W7I8Q4_HIBTR|nr:hypothetical protein HRI_002804000 [Hibiscus trionum]
MPYFSSRGPSTIPKNIFKPDIPAPGVNILAVWTGNDTSDLRPQKAKTHHYIICSQGLPCHVQKSPGLLPQSNQETLNGVPLPSGQPS